MSGIPELPFEIYEDAFADIIGIKPELLTIGKNFGFTEGPVYFSIEGKEEGYLLFSDQTYDNINMIKWYGVEPFQVATELSWSAPAVFRHPSNVANGQTADLKGRLLTAETTARRISITDHHGVISTLIGFYKGRPLNSPNDLIVKSDGSVWFTDPTYGALQHPQHGELPSRVYRFDPLTDRLDIVIEDLKMPNGIAFSPDESILYVIDSAAVQAPHTYYHHHPHAVYAYEVHSNGKDLGKRKDFAVISPGFPDGMRVDRQGNIYVGASDGVQVFNPSGKMMGKIFLNKQVGNLTFGGKDNNILFICASDEVCIVKLNTKGAKDVPMIQSQ